MRQRVMHLLTLAVVGVLVLFASTASGMEHLRADFDGDGIDDVVRATSLDGVTILAVQTSGPSPAFTFPVAAPVKDLIAADLDQDGDVDLATRSAPPRQGQRWLNDGHGRFAAPAQGSGLAGLAPTGLEGSEASPDDARASDSDERQALEPEPDAVPEWLSESRFSRPHHPPAHRQSTLQPAIPRGPPASTLQH